MYILRLEEKSQRWTVWSPEQEAKMSEVGDHEISQICALCARTELTLRNPILLSIVSMNLEVGCCHTLEAVRTGLYW